MTAYAAKKFKENATNKTSLTSMLNACSSSKHFYTKASQLNCMACCHLALSCQACHVIELSGYTIYLHPSQTE